MRELVNNKGESFEEYKGRKFLIVSREEYLEELREYLNEWNDEYYDESVQGYRDRKYNYYKVINKW